jgi:hypothetical protein
MAASISCPSGSITRTPTSRGIVYHANYLRYFERGRSDFFRLVGISHTELAQADTAFAIIRMDAGLQALGADRRRPAGAHHL